MNFKMWLFQQGLTMRLLSSALIATQIIVAAAAWADEGPKNAFGIAPGQPIAELDVAEKESNKTYKLNSVPNSHNLLSTYLAVAHPKFGVCSIIGVLPPTNVNHAQYVYLTIRNQIAEKYGEPSIFPEERQDFAILKNTSEWSFPGNKINSLSIGLFRNKTDTINSVMVVFKFDSMDKCEEMPESKNPF